MFVDHVHEGLLKIEPFGIVERPERSNRIVAHDRVQEIAIRRGTETLDEREHFDAALRIEVHDFGTHACLMGTHAGIVRGLAIDEILRSLARDFQKVRSLLVGQENPPVGIANPARHRLIGKALQRPPRNGLDGGFGPSFGFVGSVTQVSSRHRTPPSKLRDPTAEIRAFRIEQAAQQAPLGVLDELHI